MWTAASAERLRERYVSSLGVIEDVTHAQDPDNLLAVKYWHT